MTYHWVPAERKVLSLERGLYLVKYDSAADELSPPIIRIGCEPGLNEAILHPDSDEPILDSVGSVIVIRAFRSGTVQVDLATASGSGSRDATLRVEALDASVPNLNVEPFRAREPAFGADRSSGPAAAAADESLEVLGHLSRLGDVVVASNEWLGGPGFPGRIEGFSIDWPRSASGVSLRYAAASSGQSPSAAQMAGAGQFVGTRQQARPVVYVSFQLDGPNAGSYELVVDGLFTGQGVQNQRGRSITMTGLSGREPLIGLRVAVEKVQMAERPGSLPESRRRVRMIKTL